MNAHNLKYGQDIALARVDTDSVSAEDLATMHEGGQAGMLPAIMVYRGGEVLDYLEVCRSLQLVESGADGADPTIAADGADDPTIAPDDRIRMFDKWKVRRSPPPPSVYPPFSPPNPYPPSLPLPPPPCPPSLPPPPAPTTSTAVEESLLRRFCVLCSNKMLVCVCVNVCVTVCVCSRGLAAHRSVRESSGRAAQDRGPGRSW